MVNNTAIGAVLSLPHDDVQRRQTLLPGLGTNNTALRPSTVEIEASSSPPPDRQRHWSSRSQMVRLRMSPRLARLVRGMVFFEPPQGPGSGPWIHTVYEHGTLLRSTISVWVASSSSPRKGSSPFYVEPAIARPGIPQTTWYSIRGCQSPNRFPNSFFLSLTTPLGSSNHPSVSI
jgi:hypothetical protein